MNGMGRNGKVRRAWTRRGGAARRGPVALVGALGLLAGLTLGPARGYAMGEDEFFAEEAARGRVDLELLTSRGETDACFLYDKRHRAVFCVATTDATTDAASPPGKTSPEKAAADTLWVAVCYDGRRDTLTTIPFAQRPKASQDDDDWVARPKALKKINKRLRKGRWARRVYAQDFDEGKHTPFAEGYSLETRHDETELAIYQGDAERPLATYPLRELWGLYTAEGDLPLIVVDEPPAGTKGPAALRVRLVRHADLKKAAKRAKKGKKGR